jgi:hypothetical protein
MMNGNFNQISFDFVNFINEQFWFCFFLKFQTPLQKFYFLHFELKSKFKIANFQYRSYLYLSFFHFRQKKLTFEKNGFAALLKS